jgi:hypothetical protein
LNKLFVLFLLGLLCMPLFGGIVTNGTFDTGVVGWAFTNADGTTWRSGGGNPGGYAVLNNSPGPVPTMTQTLDLVVGHTYQLTWDMISAYQCCSRSTTNGAGAAIDGKLWEFIVPNTQGTWVGYSQTFTYLGSSADLSFSSQRNGTDTDAGIDNVVVTDITAASGVPEPTTWALLGSGLIALGYVRSRMARR